MGDAEDLLIDQIRQQIVNNNLAMKALIQDIHECLGPYEVLNELNCEGRQKLALFKKQIDQLANYAIEKTGNEKIQLIEEANNLREQYTSTLGAFRKANITCLLAIDKVNKEELLHSNDSESSLRLRQKKDKANLVKMSSSVTEQLRSISRHLAETTERSCDTLETLANSSSNVTAAQDELHSTGNVIQHSHKLLAKYGRREFTDKVILIFAFLFFLACVIYIITKRLF